jgi:hypothetical protein
LPKISYHNNVSDGYLIDKIFNNLIENGYDNYIKQNKYIDQLVKKFLFFRIKSPDVYFEIYIQDLDNETIQLIETYTQECKTAHQKYLKLNWIFIEVISRIEKQAEPQIISNNINEDVIVWLKSSLNEIRETVSLKWRFAS